MTLEAQRDTMLLMRAFYLQLEAEAARGRAT
jgi:hypothetical protein